jgi:hypothetical protein
VNIIEGSGTTAAEQLLKHILEKRFDIKALDINKEIDACVAEIYRTILIITECEESTNALN